MHYKPIPLTPKAVRHLRKYFPGSHIRVRQFKTSGHYPGNTRYYTLDTDSINMGWLEWEGITRILMPTGPQLFKGNVQLALVNISGRKVAV